MELEHLPGRARHMSLHGLAFAVDIVAIVCGSFMSPERALCTATISRKIAGSVQESPARRRSAENSVQPPGMPCAAYHERANFLFCTWAQLPADGRRHSAAGLPCSTGVTSRALLQMSGRLRLTAR